MLHARAAERIAESVEKRAPGVGHKAFPFDVMTRRKG